MRDQPSMEEADDEPNVLLGVTGRLLSRASLGGTYGIKRSEEPDRFHALPNVSVTPLLSDMTIGN